MPLMNDTETQTCERCGELPADVLTERNGVGEAVCYECLHIESNMVSEMCEDLNDGPECFCEGW